MWIWEVVNLLLNLAPSFCFLSSIDFEVRPHLSQNLHPINHSIWVLSFFCLLDYCPHHLNCPSIHTHQNHCVFSWNLHSSFLIFSLRIQLSSLLRFSIISGILPPSFLLLHYSSLLFLPLALWFILSSLKCFRLFLKLLNFCWFQVRSFLDLCVLLLLPDQILISLIFPTILCWSHSMNSSRNPSLLLHNTCW